MAYGMMSNYAEKPNDSVIMSGVCILLTLLYSLRDRGLRHGLARLWLGGGEVSAVEIVLV